MATVGVLCGRMRVEEKLLVAALADAGIAAEPVVPAGLPLPPARSPLPMAPAIAGGPRTDLLIDRFPERAAGAALIAASRAIGAATIDAGIAAVSDRLAVAMALSAAGIARPNTHFAWSAEAALAAVSVLGCPATLLPLAFRSEPAPLLDIDAAEAIIEHRAVLGHGVESLALIQTGVAADQTSQIIVVDGEAVAAEGPVDSAARNLATLTAHALGARLIGVEIVTTASGPIVWDVQPRPEFRHARPLAQRTVAEAVAAMALRLLDSDGLPTNLPDHSGSAALPTADGALNGRGGRHIEEVRDGFALLA